MNLITMTGITKYYDERKILEEVSLTVREGDRIGLIGDNGSGKTTLLKIILGDREMVKGQVRIRDDLKIGVLKQVSDMDVSGSVNYETLSALVFWNTNK